MPPCEEHKHLVAQNQQLFEQNTKLMDNNLKILISVENLRGEIALLNQKFDNSIENFDKHISESENRIKQIYDNKEEAKGNTQFRKNAAKGLWIIFGSIVTLFLKVFIFK